jgi:hypothetical protein
VSRRARRMAVYAVLAPLLIAAIYVFWPGVRAAFADSDGLKFERSTCIGGHEASVLSDGSVIPHQEVCAR